MQTLIERLSEVKSIKCKISELRAMKESLYYSLLPTGIDYDKDKVQTSPEDPMLKVMSKVDEIQREIDSYVDLIPEATERVMELLNIIECTDYKCIMIKWYIGGMKASDIADQMGYTEDGIYKVRRRMLAVLSNHLSSDL